MGEYNSVKAIKAQEKYCEDNHFPYFAPTNGICYKCGNNIYKKIVKKNYSTGITVEGAGNHLITGCPHCNYSYCE